MKQNKIILSTLILIISGLGSLIPIHSQTKIDLVPMYALNPPNSSNPDYRFDFWYVTNLNGTVQITNDFRNTKTLATTNPIAPFLPDSDQYRTYNTSTFNWPAIGPTSPPFGSIKLAGTHAGTFPYVTTLDYTLATETELIANKTVVTPKGDARMVLEYSFDASYGLKRLLLASSDNSIPANSTGKVASSGNVNAPILPAGWQQVSNVITVRAAEATSASTVFPCLYDLIIKYEDSDIFPQDERNLALFRFSGYEWSRERCIDNTLTSVDTTANEFIVAQTRGLGTYVVACMEGTVYTDPMVAPLTASFQFAGKQLILSGNVDSTAVLVASAGEEIVLGPGFTGLPGSRLLFNLTGSYCGNKLPISTISSARESSAEMIAEEEKEAGISVYPNPTGGAFKVRYTLATSQNIRITIKDLLGQEVKVLSDGFRELGNYEESYDTEGINTGLHLLVLESEREPVRVTKLIKQ